MTIEKYPFEVSFFGRLAPAGDEERFGQGSEFLSGRGLFLGESPAGADGRQDRAGQRRGRRLVPSPGYAHPRARRPSGKIISISPHP